MVVWFVVWFLWVFWRGEDPHTLLLKHVLHGLCVPLGIRQRVEILVIADPDYESDHSLFGKGRMIQLNAWGRAARGGGMRLTDRPVLFFWGDGCCRNFRFFFGGH